MKTRCSVLTMAVMVLVPFMTFANGEREPVAHRDMPESQARDLSTAKITMNSIAVPAAARSLLDGYYRAMLAKNADALANLYAEQAVHEFPLLTPFFPKQLNGREEIRKHYAAVWGASPIRILDLRETAVHVAQGSGTIIAEAEYTAQSPDGKSFVLSFLVVMRVENNLISRLRDYMDSLGAAHGLDRLPNLVEALKRRQ